METTKLINEKENPLFNRREIILGIKTEKTPSKAEAEKLISEKFSTNSENIKVKTIEGRFGSKEFKITANIYKSPKDKEDIEIKPKIKKV